jgi:hypothetical protein
VPQHGSGDRIASATKLSNLGGDAGVRITAAVPNTGGPRAGKKWGIGNMLGKHKSRVEGGRGGLGAGREQGVEDVGGGPIEDGSDDSDEAGDGGASGRGNAGRWLSEDGGVAAPSKATEGGGGAKEGVLGRLAKTTGIQKPKQTGRLDEKGGLAKGDDGGRRGVHSSAGTESLLHKGGGASGAGAGTAPVLPTSRESEGAGRGLNSGAAAAGAAGGEGARKGVGRIIDKVGGSPVKKSRCLGACEFMCVMHFCLSLCEFVIALVFVQLKACA